jgi:hypothetical protein
MQNYAVSFLLTGAMVNVHLFSKYEYGVANSSIYMPQQTDEKIQVFKNTGKICNKKLIQ